MDENFDNDPQIYKIDVQDENHNSKNLRFAQKHELIASGRYDEEGELICRKHKVARQKYVDEMTRDLRKTFLESLKVFGFGTPKITYAECCIALEENIAVKLFPEFFGKCDKDGLIAVSDILTDFTYFYLVLFL